VRRADNLTTFIADFLEIWESQPHGNLKASPGLSLGCFTFVEVSSKTYFKTSE